MFYKGEAPLSRSSAQRAARCIAAPRVPLERGLPRDVESLRPTRMHGSAKPMCELQNLLPRAGHTERARRVPDLLWQKADSNAIRYEDQEVRRSSTELTDDGPQEGPYPLNADLVSYLGCGCVCGCVCVCGHRCWYWQWNTLSVKEVMAGPGKNLVQVYRT
jgi:hypothetical protein